MTIDQMPLLLVLSGWVIVAIIVLSARHTPEQAEAQRAARAQRREENAQRRARRGESRVAVIGAVALAIVLGTLQLAFYAAIFFACLAIIGIV